LSHPAAEGTVSQIRGPGDTPAKSPRPRIKTSSRPSQTCRAQYEYNREPRRAVGRRPEWERPAQIQSPKTRRLGQGASALTCQGPSCNGPDGSRPPKTCRLLPGFNREDRFQHWGPLHGRGTANSLPGAGGLCSRSPQRAVGRVQVENQAEPRSKPTSTPAGGGASGDRQAWSIRVSGASHSSSYRTTRMGRAVVLFSVSTWIRFSLLGGTVCWAGQPTGKHFQGAALCLRASVPTHHVFSAPRSFCSFRPCPTLWLTYDRS
jgi:hypothetical protein